MVVKLIIRKIVNKGYTRNNIHTCAQQGYAGGRGNGADRRGIKPRDI